MITRNDTHTQDVRGSARSSRMVLSLEWRKTRDARYSAIFGRKAITWLARISRRVRPFAPFYLPFPPLVSLSPLLLVRVYNACTPTTGDPLRYHSHFVATVQTSQSTPLRPIEVVARGQLGTATKKAHLLCGCDPESREVTYISIEWASFG